MTSVAFMNDLACLGFLCFDEWRGKLFQLLLCGLIILETIAISIT